VPDERRYPEAHDLADRRRRFVDEPEDLFAQEGAIREEERRVEAIDEQAGHGDRAVVVVRVSPCGPARDLAEHGGRGRIARRRTSSSDTMTPTAIPG